MVRCGSPYDRPAPAPAKFKVGDKVRSRNIHPKTHTRLPRYARGHLCEVVRVVGCHVFPDSNAIDAGEHPQWLYTVRFDGRELWGEDSDPTVRVTIEAWEPYLELAWSLPAKPSPRQRHLTRGEIAALLAGALGWDDQAKRHPAKMWCPQPGDPVSRHSRRRPDDVIDPSGNASAAATPSRSGVSGPIASRGRNGGRLIGRHRWQWEIEPGRETT
jgi:hypothetical protein